jgi:hypothetical protein
MLHLLTHLQETVPVLHNQFWHVSALLLAAFLPLQNFFVCGRTLPLWIVIFALLAQGLDSNATLGNVALSYKYDRYSLWPGLLLGVV